MHNNAVHELQFWAITYLPLKPYGEDSEGMNQNQSVRTYKGMWNDPAFHLSV